MTDNPDGVGYKKPPRHSRFKPGQSGNPSGKPKGLRSLRDDYRDDLAQILRVTENGKLRRYTKQQVILKNMTAKAVRGENSQIARAIDLSIHLFGVGNDGEAAGTPLSSDDEAVIAAALARKLAGGSNDE